MVTSSPPLVQPLVEEMVAWSGLDCALGIESLNVVAGLSIGAKTAASKTVTMSHGRMVGGGQARTYPFVTLVILTSASFEHHLMGGFLHENHYMIQLRVYL